MVLAAPENTRELINELNNPSKLREYRKAVPGGSSVIKAGNNLYIKNNQGKVESYTLAPSNRGLRLVRGRNLNPGTELYATETAIDAILAAGQLHACIAQNYMKKGDIVVKGKNSLIVNLMVRGTCMGQESKAGPKSATYNGKTYYRVIPGQSGNDVCKEKGLTCLGMSPSKDPGVCKAFYPGASTLDQIHGSQFYWYCNGQKSIVCEQRKNTCTVCTACNPNLNCNDDPRAYWGDEVYVECSQKGKIVSGGGAPGPQQGKILPYIKPIKCIGQKQGDRCGKDACGINTMGTCGGSMQCFHDKCILVNLKPVSQRKADGERCGGDSNCQSGKCVWNTAGPSGAGYYCKTKGGIGEPCQSPGDCRDGWCIYEPAVAAPLFSMCSCNPSMYTTTQCMNVPGTNKELGHACRFDHQCKSGFCVQNTRMTKICSCDPIRLDMFSCKPATTKKKYGEVCQHAGECETPHCVYSHGEGPDRTYKCSCQMFSVSPQGC